MSGRVYITGIGIINAVGNNVNETLTALMKGKTGIGNNTLIDTHYKDILPVAEVKKTDYELGLLAGVQDTRHYTRTALLGIIAVAEAMADSGVLPNETGTGLISATSVGGMHRSEIFYREFLKDNNSGKLRDIVHHECADSTEVIAEHLGIEEFITTVSTACSSSANSLMVGARLIKSGMLHRVIAGGTDSLTLFTINGFNSLMILDKNPCRPFDETRSGLNLGEGAGFVVLESEEMLMKTGKKPYCELKGYGNACDAYHQTASSPEGNGAYLAMKKALDMSGLKASEIDYVNVHGTGTQNNDLSEGKAMMRLFNGKVPPFSSTKSFTGHTLGAAGGVEAVISVLAIRENILFPNLNFSAPIPELGLTPVTEIRRNAGVKSVLSNSFGFGGNNSAVIFSRIQNTEYRSQNE